MQLQCSTATCHDAARLYAFQQAQQHLLHNMQCIQTCCISICSLAHPRVPAHHVFASCSSCPSAAAAAAAAQAPHCQLAADIHQPTAVQLHTPTPQRSPADSRQGVLLSRYLVLPLHPCILATAAWLRRLLQHWPVVPGPSAVTHTRPSHFVWPNCLLPCCSSHHFSCNSCGLTMTRCSWVPSATACSCCSRTMALKACCSTPSSSSSSSSSSRACVKADSCSQCLQPSAAVSMPWH
jgi:hypothetical protein